MTFKKVKRPCIRGLKDFQKTGCPEKYWDRVTGQGCPAWKEYSIPAAEKGNSPVIIKDCIDCLSEHWLFEQIKFLEGNQAAIESFRNGMCEEVDGKVYPKMDRAVLSLLSTLQREKEDRHLLGSQRRRMIAE